MEAKDRIIVGLDIGTTKICVLVTKKDETGKTQVLGVGKAPSHGVMRGEVANIDKTVQSIIQAVQEAEKQSGEKIREVHVGIAGQHIKSMQHRGILTRDDALTEISKEDVKSLIRDMYKLAMNPGERIIHVLPQEFFVDSLPAKNDPVGMCGSRLEANFHIITGRVAAAQNIERCVEKSGLIMEGLILEPLASAASVLDANEKELGVALVDIGGGTTDLAIFQEGIIRHTCVIPFGGNIVTEDIKDGCKIMKSQAEELKLRFGSALAVEAKENQIISIPGLKGRPPKEISMKNLASIIQARMEEIFEQVYFITGGGSQLKFIKQLVEYVTGLDARIGYPIEHLSPGFNEELKHPMFATGIGLVERAATEEQHASKKVHVDPYDSTLKKDKEVVAPEETPDPGKNKVANWWKDIIGTLPEWLMEENDDDSKY